MFTNLANELGHHCHLAPILTTEEVDFHQYARGLRDAELESDLGAFRGRPGPMGISKV